MEQIIATSKRQSVECMNTMNLIGSVVHKYRPNPAVIILTVAVKGCGQHEVDYPNVVFYGEDTVSSIDENIVVDKEAKNFPRVRIEGGIQTKRIENDNGVRFLQNLVGESISLTQSRMESITGKKGVGSHKADSVNEVCVLGTVTNVFPVQKQGVERPIGVVLTVRTQIDGRTNFPKITCFNSQVASALNLAVGDVICATAFVETTNKRTEDNGFVRYESVVASEVVKIDE